MWYPVLNPKQKQQTTIETFGGYNHTARPAEAEFYDMQNMSGDDFPLLSTRARRGVLPVQDAYVGRMAKDGKLLCLKDSGDETLKLTVRESVEAAELETRPQNTSIPEPDLQTTIYCSADASVFENKQLTVYKEANERSTSYLYENLCITSSEETNVPGVWQVNLERSNISLLEKSIIVFQDYNKPTDDKVYKLLTIERVESGWLYATVTLGSEKELLRPNNIHGQLNIGLSANFYLKHSNNTQQLVIGMLFVSCEIISRSLDPNLGSPYEKCQIRISISDIYNKIRGENQSVSTITGVERNGYSYLYYPVAYAPTEFIWNDTEYRSQIAEADAEDRAAIEQWEANKVTALTLREMLTEDVASALKNKNINIGETSVYVENAVSGKSGEGTLYISKPHGAIAAGSQIDTGERYLSLCTVDPQSGAESSAPIGRNTGEGTRTMLSMGARVVVFPDKLWVNTIERDEAGRFTDYGPLELSSTLRGQGETEQGEVRSQTTLIVLCDAQYQYIGSPTVQKTAPASPSNGAYWLDNSKTDVQLKVYSTATNMWSAVEPYLKIYSVGLSAGYEAGDAVRIMDGKKAWTHENVQFGDEKESHIVYDAGEEEIPADLQAAYGKMKRGYIVVRGILTTGGALEPAQEDKVCMTIRRTVPDMEYVVESGNRLWGCHYGKNADGETVNEIYACKQGDPKNWFSYEGTAMDSYAASIGTDGAFTGAAVYAGNPIFFKENYMHRVYGSYPANYQIYTQAVHGVQPGSARSAAVVNERLLYKASDGVYLYDGSIPYLLSEAFGRETYAHAVAASANGKYYVSLEKPDGSRTLMVYDLAKGLWLKEDGLPVRELFSLGQTVIAVTRDGRLLDLTGKYGEAEPPFEWFAESGNIGYSVAAKKFVGRMLLRMDLSAGAFVLVQIAYDNDRTFTDLYTSSGEGVDSICVPIRPHRCDHFRIRICGKGDAKLISVTKTIKGGSDK